MSYQPIRFYQTGTFTVGNRLLPTEERSVQANMRRTNSLNSGHRACQGCGEALGARYAIDAAMEATDRQLVAANATGCLEVFSTPYPETSWQIPWIHSLFGNAAAVATGIAAAMRVKGRERRARRRAGRRRRHHRHRLRLPVGHVRAQRRRALHLLRQRGLHEHRRAALLGDAARRAHQHDDARRATPRATASARARTCRSSRWRTRSPTSPPPPSPNCATSRPRCGARWSSAARATSTSWCPARSAGATARPRRSAWRGWRTRRGCSRSSRPSTARSTSVSKIRRQLPVEEYLRPQQRFAHLFKPPRTSGHRRAAPAARRPQHPPLRAARRHGGHAHEAQALRHHARPGLEPRQPHGLLAHGAPRVHRPAAALQPRLPRGREHPGLAVPRRGGRLRAGLARADAGQPAARRDGPRLLSPLRDRVQSRPARRERRHQRRSSASSATRPCGAAGSSRRRRRRPASACWSWAPGRRGCRPRITWRASATR